MSALTLFTLLANLISHLAVSLPPMAATEAPKRAPVAVKALYVTSATAQLPERLAELIQIISKTELNAMVINTKEPFGPQLDEPLSDLVAALHQAGAWVIARQVVFQDDDLPQRRPELALKRANGSLWLDRGGRAWVDPANEEVWQYNLELARQALALGFDEINLDYIRFPTDGDVKKIVYPSWDGITLKEEVLKGFLHWFKQGLKASSPYAVLSVDVFGETFLQDTGGNTGQRLSVLAPEVDVVAPMLYPSHYRRGNFGLINPATDPYRVVYGTLKKGVGLLINSPATVIRPWLQDFNLGATYMPQMVRAQITATEDAGYHSGFMLWNPKNIYSESALLKE